MSVKLLTEIHLEFLSLKGGCTGSSESTLVKMPHCWKSHVTAQYYHPDLALSSFMKKSIGLQISRTGSYIQHLISIVHIVSNILI